MNQALIEFNPKLPKLTANEKAVLKLLVEAGKLIVPIYQQQLDNGRSNFYPKGVRKSEIEKVARQDPAILSPYTVVEKVNGKLITVPYHVKYSDLLEPVVEKLMQAARITHNREFGHFLALRAKSLLDGSYEQALAARFKLKPYVLDIAIGPLANFDDHLFYAKASYQAWVGVLDKEGTDRFNNYKTVTLSAIRKGVAPHRIDNHESINAKVLDVLLFSGLIARTRFVGVHLPTNSNLIEKYGSEIVLFNQPNDLKVKQEILPIFNRIFAKEIKEEFEFEDLRRGYLRAVALHELAHSYLHYENAAKNLEDLFPLIDELAATILGLRLAGTLLLKDRITNKQLESMIVAFLCRAFYQKEKIDSPQEPLYNYAFGGNVFINYMFQQGAIKESGKTILPNFMKVFLSLHDLSDSLEKLLALGSRREAEAFVKKYSKR